MRTPTILAALLAVLLGTGCTTILRPDAPPAGRGRIVLTFDDGPNPVGDVSEQLLDVLDRQHVPATFFYMGEQVAKCPATVARAHAAGHELGLHTYGHAVGQLYWSPWLRRETDATIAAIRAAIGDPTWEPRLYRPPFGLVTPPAARFLRETRLQPGLTTVLAYDPTATAADWPALEAKLERHLLAANGGIVVIHERRYWQVFSGDVDKTWLPPAVDALITWAKANGFVFVKYDTASL